MRNNQREKRSIQPRVELFNQINRRKQFKPDQFKAALAGLLRLDHNYHLEGIVQMLRNLQVSLAAQALNLKLSEEQKRETIAYMNLLRDLADEFDWQSHYGIRLYEPL